MSRGFFIFTKINESYSMAIAITDILRVQKMVFEECDMPFGFVVKMEETG